MNLKKNEFILKLDFFAIIDAIIAEFSFSPYFWRHHDFMNCKNADL